MASLVYLGLLLVAAAANAEICRYEFIVPEEKCKPLGVAQSEEEPHSVMNPHFSGVDSINEKINGIAESFGNQITKLDVDSKNLKEIASVIQNKMETTAASVAKLEGLMEEVKTWRQNLGNGDSKIEDLKSKMLDMAAKFQTQTTTQSAMYASVQKHLSEMASSIAKHSRDIESLKGTFQSAKNVIDNAHMNQPGQNLANLEARLGKLEEQMSQSSQDNGVIEQLKSAVNILQNNMVASIQQYQQQIGSLSGTMTSIQSEVETLKRGFMTRK